MNRHRLLLLETPLLCVVIACSQACGQGPRPAVPGAVALSQAPQQVGITNGMSCKQSLEAAIAAFKLGDDESALAYATSGLTQCPTDPVLLEFRGLVQFARGDYRDASVSIHRVMATGPGWNWATVHDLYPSVDTYTRHLRALEAYTKKHPDDGAARFLQAYHYKVDGYPDAAVRELQMVVRLEAYDPVAVELLKKLSRPVNGTPANSVPAGRY